MKVLITGANGQLGRELCEVLMGEGYEVFPYGKNDLNIGEIEAVRDALISNKPDVVINCAAYTKVDDCESHYSIAYAVNVIGPRNLAVICKALDVKLLHLSTDFVFSGDSDRPYFEYDPVQPLSVYGQTKLAGEKAIQREMTQYFIIRTSWLYGKYGHNFVKTMLSLAQTKKKVEVVSDQIGSPTLTTDLIHVIIKLMRTESYGLYHFANSGHCSWHEFADEIFIKANADVVNKPISSEMLNRPAKRPRFSVMDTRMIQVELDYEIRHWKLALNEFLKNMDF